MATVMFQGVAKPKELIHKKICVVGHGRGATSYANAYLNSVGIRTKHEHVGLDGIVDSAFSVPTWPVRGGFVNLDLTRDYYQFDHKFCILRDPFKTVGTYYIVEHPNAIWNHKGHIDLDDANGNMLEAICLSVCRWTRSGLAWCDGVGFRAEDVVTGKSTLPAWLKERDLWLRDPRPISRKVNHRAGRRPDRAEILSQIRPEIAEELLSFAAEWDYA